MFDLNQAVIEWRRQMKSAGIRDIEMLDELEEHLREDIRGLLSGGLTDSQAFELAKARLGDKDSMGAEYGKLNRWPSISLAIGMVGWVGAFLGLVFYLAKDLSIGRINFLLFSHIVIITAAYVAALMAGTLGCVWAACQRMGGVSFRREWEWERMVRFFGYLAAGCAMVGFVLGQIWSADHPHLILHWLDRPREMGGWLGTAWLVAVALVQRFGRLQVRGMMLMVIAGNIVICLEWFIPILRSGAIFISPMQPEAIGTWGLAVFVVIQLLFLKLGSVKRAKYARF